MGTNFAVALSQGNVGFWPDSRITGDNSLIHRYILKYPPAFPARLLGFRQADQRLRSEPGPADRSPGSLNCQPTFDI